MGLHPRFSRAVTAGFVLTTLLVAPVGARTRTADVRSTTADVSRIRIDNFGRINPNFYRGAQPRGRDYVDLASLGVKTVINLASDDADPAEQSMSERAGLRYVQIPMTTHQAPTADQIARFLAIVNDPASQPVYVHCVGGRHRTGVMTAGYRMTHDGWSADRAFQEMKQYKFGADFLHAEFKQFVYGYRAADAPAAVPAPAVATKAGS
jgi:protein tyrosine/serine phosphatase